MAQIFVVGHRVIAHLANFCNGTDKNYPKNIAGVDTEFRGFIGGTTETILRFLERLLTSNIKYVFLLMFVLQKCSLEFKLCNSI